MLQIKIFKGTSGKAPVENQVNKWLESREVQKFKIIKTHFAASAGAYGSMNESVMVEYDDEGIHPSDRERHVAMLNHYKETRQ